MEAEMIEGYEHFVGIDWGNEHHQVCVVDRRGKVVEKRRVPNNGEGLQAVVELCRKWGRAAVGIETPRGALVETLLAAQVPVFHINPKQAERIRERYNAAGAKDDRLDAFSAADGLRTDSVDRPCFRRVEVTPDHLAELQTIGRLDQSMTKDRVRVQNRLREAVLLVHPALLTLCVGADEAWLWAVLEQFVGAARKPLTSEVQAILRKHRIRRISAEAIVAALRQEGAKVSDGSIRAAKITIRALVPQLRCIEQEQRTLAKQLREILQELESGTAEGQSSEHRDVAILRSMPGVGDKTAAAMLAEVPQFLRTRNYPALRAITGVAPVTDATGKRSGNRATVKMRRGCRTRLRTVMHMWAGNAMLHDPGWRAVYERMRARGKKHNDALRSLGDRLLRVLVGALKRGTPYDPAILSPPAPG